MAETRFDFVTCGESARVELDSANAPQGAKNKEANAPIVTDAAWRRLTVPANKRTGEFRTAGLSRPVI